MKHCIAWSFEFYYKGVIGIKNRSAFQKTYNVFFKTRQWLLQKGKNFLKNIHFEGFFSKREMVDLKPSSFSNHIVILGLPSKWGIISKNTICLRFTSKWGYGYFIIEQLLEQHSHLEFYSKTGEWLLQNAVAFQDWK